MLSTFKKPKSKTILILILIVLCVALYSGIYVTLDFMELYGIINTHTLLKGSSDLVIKCEGLEVNIYCIGKAILVGVGP